MPNSTGSWSERERSHLELHPTRQRAKTKKHMASKTTFTTGHTSTRRATPSLSIAHLRVDNNSWLWKTWVSKHSKHFFVPIRESTFRGGSRGRVQGVRTPPPYDDLRLSDTTGILQKKNCVVYWCWSTARDESPPPKKILDPPLLKFDFFIFTTQVTLFFLERRNLKFSDSKMWWREESEKFSLS